MADGFDAFCAQILARPTWPGNLSPAALAEEFVRHFDLSGFPRFEHMEHLVRNAGVGQVVEARLPDRLRGVHVGLRNGHYTIKYRNDDWDGGREHTVLHETYKILQEKFSELCPSWGLPGKQTLCRRADRFAAAVLMQPEVFALFAQATGLDVEALDCDFYSIPGQKWLLGPDGAGALYLRKELIPGITPRYPTSAAAESRDRAAREVRMNAASPRKFALSTTSTALEAGMAEAISYNQEIGSAAIEARSMELAEVLKRSLQGIPGFTLTCPQDPELGSGLVTFTLAGKEPRQVVEALWERGIAGRQVPEPPGIRLCTAFFNTEDEVQRVAEALEGIARG